MKKNVLIKLLRRLNIFSLFMDLHMTRWERNSYIRSLKRYAFYCHDERGWFEDEEKSIRLKYNPWDDEAYVSRLKWQNNGLKGFWQVVGFIEKKRDKRR